jgi:hypothetical protein
MIYNSITGKVESHPAGAIGTSGRKYMLSNPRGGNMAGKVREKQACPALPVITGNVNPAVNTLLYTNKTINPAGNALLYMNKTINPAGNTLLYMNKTINPAGNALLYTNKSINPAGFIKIKIQALAKKQNFIINI